MRVLNCHRAGDPPDLRLDTIERPTLAPNEIRIAVHHAGLNFPDRLVITGKYQLKPPLPFTPGMECSGSVLEMGSVGFGCVPLDPAEVEQLRPGFDDRLVWRYYRDPPEFLTVMHGGTDGLHYGLWFDDPREGCVGVASYYNSDSCEISWKGETLLTAVRQRLEVYEGWAADWSTDPAEVLERRVRLAVLRDSILEYETADISEVGNRCPLVEAAASYARSEKFRAGRIATVDSIGAKVPGTTLERDPSAVIEAIESGGAPVDAMIAEALAECAAGRPALALALGRDFFALSFGQKEREAVAAQLLEAAYRALGRDCFAEIVAVHTRYRHLGNVDDFRGDPPE